MKVPFFDERYGCEYFVAVFDTDVRE